jgi:hypothetical protein
MYDGGKIITGLIIGIVLLTYPFWSNLGKASPRPEIVLPTKSKQCVEPREYMRAKHMQVLDLWRDSTVRAAKRLYIGDDGQAITMSLQNTCMRSDCHAKKSEFCDRCHDYTGVRPYCWDCHMPPKETK